MNTETTEQDSERGDPIRGVIILGGVLLAVIFGYSTVADRLTPYTGEATVRAYTARISPLVSGQVIQIEVEENQPVQAGQPLFRLDASRYEVAVAEAETRLAVVGQAAGVSVAALDAAQARLVQAIANHDSTQLQTARTQELVRAGLAPVATRDMARSALDQAESAVASARADLDRARQALGPKAADLVSIRDALVAIERAKLDLIRTTVTAPFDGVVTLPRIAVGQFAEAGQPALTLLDTRQIWVVAPLREESLLATQAGDKVDIAFSVLPGTLFKGHVVNTGWGVSDDEADPALANRPGASWLVPARRFPARIALDVDVPPKAIRYGSRADVMVYATDSRIPVIIGKAWMRVIGLASYLS